MIAPAPDKLAHLESLLASAGIGRRYVVPKCRCGNGYPGESHWLQSPECWDRDQADRKLMYERYRSGYQCRCRRCQRTIYSITGHARHCIRCQIENRREHQRQRRAATKPATLTCLTCACEFTPKRSDAVHCSGRCRQRAYRAALRVANRDIDTAASTSVTVTGEETVTIFPVSHSVTPEGRADG